MDTCTLPLFRSTTIVDINLGRTSNTNLGLKESSLPEQSFEIVFSANAIALSP